MTIFISKKKIFVNQFNENFVNQENEEWELYSSAKEYDFIITPQKAYIFTEYCALQISEAKLVELLEVPMWLGIGTEVIEPFLNGKAKFVVPDNDNNCSKIFDYNLMLMGEIPYLVGLNV